MTFSFEFSKEFTRIFTKLPKKDSKQAEIIIKKIHEIKEKQVYTRTLHEIKTKHIGIGSTKALTTPSNARSGRLTMDETPQEHRHLIHP